MEQIQKLITIMAQLRDKENGCPWDVEQNFASIAPHTLEEAYEVVDAIEKNDMQHLKEELGDLLLQVIFHSQMAKEEGHFDIEAVAESISLKLVSRHPHVFGDADIKTAEAQEKSWEELKAKERQQKNHQAEQQSVLDDVALALPALTRASKLQKRAAAVGFDWPTIEPVFAKIEEEIAEIKEEVAAGDVDKIHDEIGDLLFCIVNLARHLKIKPEEALRSTNKKFIDRFQYIEQKLKEKGSSCEESTLEEMDALWDEAKVAGGY